MKKVAARLLPFLGFGDRSVNLLGHPYALARTSLRAAITRLAQHVPDGPMLDVGCGTMPYRSLFPKGQPYEGLEIDQERNRTNPRVRYFYDGYKFPMVDACYSTVLCSQVLEHSFTPEQLLDECRRVLRPGGALLLTIPFLWPEHEQPWDSQRFTHFGLQHRLEASGFQVVQMLKLNPGLSGLLQIGIDWNESFERRLEGHLPDGWPRLLLYVTWRILWVLPYSIVNLLGALYRKLQNNQYNPYLKTVGTRQMHGPEIYLDLVVLATKSDPVSNSQSTTSR